MKQLFSKLGWFRPVVRLVVKDCISGAVLWSGSPLYLDEGYSYVFVRDPSKGADACAAYKHIFVRHLITLEKHYQ